VDEHQKGDPCHQASLSDHDITSFFELAARRGMRR
jgi:hypothetical protein